jgi:glutamate-1-semialdehyde aminotransferase
MTYWRSPFPILVEQARGARLADIDGHTYTDYCLGEGAALFGHSPAPLVERLQAQLESGLSHRLPTEDAAWVGEALTAHFGMPEYKWHFALSATDAHRFVLGVFRAATRRQVVLVFIGFYHGTVEELLGPTPSISLTSASEGRTHTPVFERSSSRCRCARSGAGTGRRCLCPDRVRAHQRWHYLA